MSLPHIALYRKYRPDSFSQVVGQDNIVNLLTSSIKQKKISHAYLFCGGRGTGKTTVARIFAREIGCNSEDIIEIDAASNRGIDEIRELREAVRTAPFSSHYKVYIIDEAHMLTKEASNALLKTLEEPPSHVVFILATTDPNKLPETIVSRCQKISFSLPDVLVLSERLSYVAKEEGVNLTKEVSDLIATYGKSSYRDALSVLEQILTNYGKKVSYEDVINFLGISERTSVLLIVKSICEKNNEEFINVVNSLSSKNISPIKVFDDVVEVLRQGLLSRIGKKDIDEEIASLSKKYPYTFNSKTILQMLSNRHLLEVSTISPFTSFEAIIITFLEENKE